MVDSRYLGGSSVEDLASHSTTFPWGATTTTDNQKTDFKKDLETAFGAVERTAKGEVVDRDTAQKLTDLIGAKTAPNPTGNISMSDIEAVYGGSSKIKSAPAEATFDDVAVYYMLMKATDKVIKNGQDARGSADALGYKSADFEAAVQGQYDALMSGSKSNGNKTVAAVQLESSLAFAGALDTYKTNADKWQKAYTEATKHSDDKKAVDDAITDTTAKLEAAIKRREAWKTGGGTAGDDEDKRTTAAFGAALKSYESAVSGAGVAYKDQNALKGAIEHKIHQAIDEQKTTLASGLATLTDEDKKALGAVQGKYDKTLVQEQLGITPGKGRAASTISADGKGKSGDDKGMNKDALALGALAAAGVVAAVAGAKSGKEQTDPTTGEVTQKKGFMGKVVAAVGVVTTVAAILALTRGKAEEGAMNKLKTGVSFGGRGA